MQANNKPTHYLSFYLVVKKLTTLVSTFSFFVTLGFALESFLLVLLRGNAKIVSKALVPAAVYKALRVFVSRRYVTGIPSIFTIPKLYLGEHSEVSQAWTLHTC